MSMNPLYAAMNGNQSGGADLWQMIRQIQSNPIGMLRQAGYNVPDGIGGNPQEAVMHLMRTGQVGGAMMQRIQPIMSMLTGGKMF